MGRDGPSIVANLMSGPRDAEVEVAMIESSLPSALRGEGTVTDMSAAAGGARTQSAPIGLDPDDRPANVLIVDDDAGAILVLNRILSDIGRLRFATSGPMALELAREEIPDVVLLDIEMPGMSGLEVCAALKADPAMADLPVIFITSHHSQDDELAGLAAGAVDFIAKPPLAPLVRARVRTHLRLKRLTDMLRQSAVEDPVTGISNRRKLEETLPKEWLRCLRERLPISLLMIDIDFFKEYNDARGHLNGDRCLRLVSQRILAVARADHDLLARYGGDEFALVLPNTDARAAADLAQRLQTEMRDAGLPHPSSSVSDLVTVSIGGATHLPAGDDSAEDRRRAPASLVGPGDLLMAADLALYDAKQQGRARVRFRPIRGVAGSRLGIPPVAQEGGQEHHV